MRKELTIHSFRAGFATILYRAVKDPLLVAHALGHKAVRNAERFIHLHENSLEEAVRKAFG